MKLEVEKTKRFVVNGVRSKPNTQGVQSELQNTDLLEVEDDSYRHDQFIAG